MNRFANGLALVLTIFLFMAMLAPNAAFAQLNPDKLKVAVLPFQVNAGDDLSYLKDSLPELLGERLEKLGFTVIGEEIVQSILDENNIEFLDLATAKDIALLAGANYSLYGSFSQAGDTISIDVRLVEAFGVKPAKPLFVVQDGLINAIPALDELAEKVRMELMKKERIQVIEVEGTKALEKDVVLLRLQTSKGDIYDPKAINEDLKNIYGLGYFDDVQIRVDELPEGVKVTFVVKEKPRISVVDVLGNEELDDDEILGLLNSRAGDVMNPKVLSDDIGKVLEEYRKEGYYNAKVTHEVEGAESGMARLNIVVDEGEKLFIQEIRIVGAEQLDEDDLKDELALGEHGFLSWITDSGVLKEEYLNRDSAALEAYYGNHGFIRAQVGQPKVDFREDGIYVTFEVHEGTRYRVGEVTFQGDLLETPDKLKEIIEADDLSEDEEYFDRSVIRKDMQKLTDYYSEYGYAFAEGDYRIRPNEETGIADVAFVMQKRKKIYIRRVTVQGNNRTRDNVILREMRLLDGDLFSGKKLKRSTQRLNQLGYFESVDIETIPVADEGVMDLKVRVKETTTGELSAGAGWASSDGIYLTTRVSERNLFGKGYTASLEGSWGGSFSSYTASLVNPHFQDSEWLLGVESYIKNDEGEEYDQRTIGGRVRTGRPIGEYTRWNVMYQLENYNISDVDSDASGLVKSIEGSNWFSSVGTDVTRSTLDRRINPSEGSKSSFFVQYAGGLLMGDDDFMKYIADHSQYVPLWWDHVFHGHIQAGYLHRTNSNDSVPVTQRFYLGGMNDVRGYKSNYISPRDGSSGDRIGGHSMAFTNLEYLFPILKDMGLMGVFFFDAGQVWEEYESPDLDWKKSIGGGIRWYSAFGPLRLEYGYALDEVREQGSKGKLEFTIGQFF